jgi:pimeloyl-ACP methyl ester carboxylesterase
MTLHVQAHGSGRPLVVLPSFSLDHAAMAEAIEPAFSDVAGWMRLYVDLPGTGSSPPGEPRSDVVLDDVVGAVQDQLGDERFVVAGWSYGGYLAAGMTRRLPEQVSGLMMVCSGFKIRPKDRDVTGVLASNPDPEWLTGVPPALHEHLAHAVGRQTAAVADRIVRILACNGPTDAAYLASLRGRGFALPDEDAQTLCDGPVCFLAGRRDRVAGYVGLFEALGQYGHASYAAVAQAGHYLPLEQPTLFAAAICTWLAECRIFLDASS